jgi:hypothetical protein
MTQLGGYIRLRFREANSGSLYIPTLLIRLVTPQLGGMPETRS